MPVLYKLHTLDEALQAAAALRAEGFRILPFSICPRPAEAWVARP